MKSIIKLSICFLFSGMICHSQYRNSDIELREYFHSILYLSGEVTNTVQIDGQQFEVIYRRPWTDETMELKTTSQGTGFFLKRGLDVYLVTAEHVARALKSTSNVKYLGVDGQKKETTIRQLNHTNEDLDKLVWVRHSSADIALLHLGIYENVVEDIGVLDYEYLEESIKAPNRFNDLTIIGYPLGLGVNPLSISPITRNTRSASDIVYFRRFDNGKLNPFIITDDASIGGFSGGPVLEIQLIKKTTDFIGKQVRLTPTIVGLVHGTIAQKQSGGFAAIVPSFQILETLKLAPKFNGEYTFYYPDGKLWSKRIYKDGLPWSVLSNFNSKGEPQEKGTLKEGEGFYYVWNEEGTRAEVVHCSKGKCSGGVYAYPKQVLPNSKNLKSN